MKTIECTSLFRDLELDRVDRDSRTVDLSFSSEDPYTRWFGVEILDHGSKSVRLDRLKRAGVGLFNHDANIPIGVLSDIRIDNGRGRARLKFFDDDDGERIFGKVKSGLRNVSVGYRIHELVLEKQSDDGPDVYRVTDWEPFEVSIVSVPADATVGVGRSDETYSVRILENHMKDQNGGGAEPSRRDNAAQQAGADAERQRARGIRELAAHFSHVEAVQQLATKAIDDGWDLERFNRQALEALGQRTFEPKPITSHDIPGFERQDAARFDFLRLVRGLAVEARRDLIPDARLAKQWRSDAGFEFEVCEAYAKVLKRDPNHEASAIIPDDLLWGRPNSARTQQRLLDFATEGGDVGHTALEDPVPILRAMSVVAQAGAIILPGLQGTAAVQIPQQTGKGAITWLAESGTAGDTTQTFGNVSLAPHTMSARTDISRRALLQSSFGMSEFIQNDLRLGMQVELDRVAIEGNPDLTASANEPRGLLNTNGIGSVGIATHGGALLRSHLIDLVTEVARDNALLGTPWFLMNSLTIGYLMKLLLDSGSGRFVMEKRNEAVGYPVGESQNVPADLAKGSGTNLNAVAFGDFKQMVIGLWSGQDLLVDPYTQGATGALRLVAFQDCDIAIRRVQSFGAIVDAVIT